MKWRPRAWWGRFSRGVRDVRDPGARERDLTDELEHFFAEAEADLLSQGHRPEEARRAVRLRHGVPENVRDTVRAYGWENRVRDLASDFRLAARRLTRAPGFTTTAVLTLGLGIGATAAIYGVVKPVLLESYGYPGEDRIVALSMLNGDGAIQPVAFGTYAELATRGESFLTLAVHRSWEPTLASDGRPERLQGQRVSARYFDVLGVQPASGGGFEAGDDRPSGARVVVLSHGLWADRFDGRPDIVGQSVPLNGLPYRVVGVMPQGFENATAPSARLWTLLQYDSQLPGFQSREWGLHLGMVGRLPGNLSLDRAHARLSEIAETQVPQYRRPEWASMEFGFRMERLREATTSRARPTVLILMSAAALLLTIATLNVTMLLLAQGKGRRGELAMRMALGAGWSRLVRQLLVESLLLSAVGGAVGIAIGWAGVTALSSVLPASFPRLQGVGMDLHVIVFAFLVAVSVGVAIGLAPLRIPSGGLLVGAAVERAQRGAVRGWTNQRGLVAIEVALALVLLVGAGLLVRSTHSLFSLPTGFADSNRMVMQVSATGLDGDEDNVHRFYGAALTAVRETPGVRSAAFTTQLPLSGDVDSYGITLDEPDRVAGADGSPYRYVVSPGYLETMEIPVLLGRALAPTDRTEAPPVVALSEALADRLFPNGNALGRRIRIGAPGLPPFTIVGVVGNVTQESLDTDRREAVYVSAEQWHWPERVRWLVVHRQVDGEAVSSQVQQAVWTADANQPIVRSSSMSDLVARSEARRRFVMLVLSAFAVVAVMLAGVGLYGVMAGSVAERLPEIGVRSALGATSGELMGLIMRQGMAWVGVGTVAGTVMAVITSRVLTSLLFGVSRLDPVTYGSVMAVVAVVAFVACWVPALRAASVDPVEAIGGE